VLNLPKFVDESYFPNVKYVSAGRPAVFICKIQNVDLSNITLYYNGRKVTRGKLQCAM